MRGTWTFGRTIVEAVRARLDETSEGTVNVNGRSVTFDAAPKEIVTLLVRLELGSYPGEKFVTSGPSVQNGVS
jgi:hypothetical protein